MDVLAFFKFDLQVRGMRKPVLDSAKFSKILGEIENRFSPHTFIVEMQQVLAHHLIFIANQPYS
jgi:hypothetical protein